MVVSPTTIEETIEEILSFHFSFSGEVVDNISYSVWDEEEITTNEITRAIEETKLRKAPGPDGIPFEVVRELFYVNKCWFKEIFDVCYRAGVFPRTWKKARVVLIPKKGKDPTACNAYRPICLLPCWGKLFDKLIKNRLTYYLEGDY